MVMQPGIFNFAPIDRIVHGTPTAEAMRAEADRLGARRVFLLVSRTLNRETDAIERIRARLGSAHAGSYEGIAPHTPREAVLAAAECARDAGADMIASVGGGSVTDAGKMLRLCLWRGITDVDGFDAYRLGGSQAGTQPGEGPIPQVAVPTTLSAGEYHGFASCTDTRVNAKHSYVYSKLVPRVTVLDPGIALATPMQTWLSTGVRALDHAIESICAKFPNSVCDGYSIQAIRMLARNLPITRHDPDNLEARQECQFGAWLSMAGTSQLNVVKGLSHALGRSLGGTCNVPHGLTSCFTLPAALRFNRDVNPDRQALVAEAFGRPGADAADLVEELVAALGLPGRLSQVGVGPEDFDRVAQNAMDDPHLRGSPRQITGPQELVSLLATVA